MPYAISSDRCGCGGCCCSGCCCGGGNTLSGTCSGGGGGTWSDGCPGVGVAHRGGVGGRGSGRICGSSSYRGSVSSSVGQQSVDEDVYGRAYPSSISCGSRGSNPCGVRGVRVADPGVLNLIVVSVHLGFWKYA